MKLAADVSIVRPEARGAPASSVGRVRLREVDRLLEFCLVVASVALLVCAAAVTFAPAVGSVYGMIADFARGAAHLIIEPPSTSG